MSAADPTGSLSGLWRGRYTYPDGQAPTAFTAELSEDAGWLTGATLETPDTGPDAGQPLAAALQGRRDGAQVRFLKTYDRPSRLRDSIAYEGVLNAEATEITGTWTIPGGWSGGFMMVRASAMPEAAAREVGERV